ncbi:MAG: transglycosylase domain-containing protein [Actinomycetota bacterium]|nr:transglycosylase domain-containing protein [Actinomycetota bacterium]
MARTHERKTSRGKGANGPKRPASVRPVRLPDHRKKGTAGGRLGSKILRFLGILFLCALVSAAAFAAGGYLGLIKGVERLGEAQNVETRPTYIYSAPLGGNEDSRRVIGTVFQGQNRKTASLAQMPPQLLNAVVAKEDERFREHGGVDLWGIMRALWVDIRAGEAVEGASTITQQYVKNAYLSQDRSITRKVKEALIAIEIERKKESKDQIIADYLNTVYYGNNAYGVEAAAETYFNKSVEDLSVAESATLVGLLWSPSTLGEDREGARYQRDLVLRKMFDAGYVASQDYNEALEAPMPRRWPAAPMMESGFTGPSATLDFAELAYEELISMYGANTIMRGGLSVYTTIDLPAQVAAREIAYGPDGYLPGSDDPDLALVSLDPETGRIMAMVGDRDEASQFNLVTQGRRQPGSAFKPFALIAALEQGIDPGTKYVSEREKEYLIDVGLDKPEKWTVRNYDGIVRGEISLAEALWWSDNTVFADLAMNAEGRGLVNGPEKIVDVAKRLGISVDFPQEPHPSVVLGTQEVSPLDLATAYATIANEGRRVRPTTISLVVRGGGQGEGKVLYEAPEHPQGEQVIDEEIAHKATEVMIGDVTEGIAKDAALGDRPVAGKTGTSENFFDAWFVGFTPQMVTGIWMGYGEGGQTLENTLDYARKLNGLSGGVTPAEIWQDYMEEVMRGKPIEQFEGVEMPEKEEPQPGRDPSAIPQENSTNTAAGATTTDPPLEKPAVAAPPGAASAAPSSVAPSSAGPSNPEPLGAPSGAVGSSADPSGAATSSIAPSSAAPSSVGPASAAPR